MRRAALPSAPCAPPNLGAHAAALSTRSVVHLISSIGAPRRRHGGGEDGVARIADFGVSHFFADEDAASAESATAEAVAAAPVGPQTLASRSAAGPLGGDVRHGFAPRVSTTPHVTAQGGRKHCAGGASPSSAASSSPLPSSSAGAAAAAAASSATTAGASPISEEPDSYKPRRSSITERDDEDVASPEAPPTRRLGLDAAAGSSGSGSSAGGTAGSAGGAAVGPAGAAGAAAVPRLGLRGAQPSVPSLARASTEASLPTPTSDRGGDAGGAARPELQRSATAAHPRDLSPRSASKHVAKLERSRSRGQMHRTEGTWAFWAPEMCKTGGYSAYCADVWATGVCLYVFVAAKLPASSRRARCVSSFDFCL